MFGDGEAPREPQVDDQENDNVKAVDNHYASRSFITVDSLFRAKPNKEWTTTFQESWQPNAAIPR